LQGFVRRIAPSRRPVGYMANGSFQGKLLSAHETKPVSLTHRSREGREDRREEEEYLPPQMNTDKTRSKALT
jgi:hypothetical protein